MPMTLQLLHFLVCLDSFLSNVYSLPGSNWQKHSARAPTCRFHWHAPFPLISQGGIQHWHNFSSYSFSSLNSPLSHDFVLLLLLEYSFTIVLFARWLPKHVLLCDPPTCWCFGIFHKECY